MELIVKQFDELTLYELYALLQLRVDVFVVEQQCPYHELDDRDQQAYHLFYRDKAGIQAYLRVFQKEEGSSEVWMGRIVTRKRRSGLGSQILQAGINLACSQLQAKEIHIEAQTYARGFYEKAGFVQTTDEFLEDGIPHIGMVLIIR